MSRRWEIDMLRGFMLVMMFCTHLPSRFANPLGQPLGYVSAAEGFVMLSAFMAGLIYTRRAEKDGIPAMRRAFFRRALTVYACQAALLIFLFSTIAALGLALDQHALTDLLDYYLKDPTAGLLGALLLIYNPPLLDILPLYIVLLLISPFVLAWGMTRGWTGIFILSGVLWVCAQFQFSLMLYDKLVWLTGFPVPFSETGAFETYAWQFLWVFGLWMGAATAKGSLKAGNRLPAQLVIAAVLIAAICLVWRHIAGQIPVPGDGGHIINRLFDKWHLGPLRLMNFFALLVLILRFGDWLTEHVPRIRFLEDLGAASLPVFCAHLVFVLLALSVAGQYRPGRPLWIDLLLLATGLVTLYATAQITLRLDKDQHARVAAARIERKLARRRSRLQKDAIG
jgi:hypothetical protein